MIGCRMKNIMSVALLCVGVLAVSACSAKTPKDFKKQWVRAAAEFNVSDSQGCDNKKELLDKFDKVLKKLKEARQKRASEEADKKREAREYAKENGFVRKNRPDWLGAVFSRHALDDLHDFLDGLKSYLKNKMYYSWAEVLRGKREYAKYLSRDRNGRGGSNGIGVGRTLIGLAGINMIGSALEEAI